VTQQAPTDAVTTHRPGFQGELDSIRDGVMALSRDVVVQIERAIWGLRNRNPDICTTVIEYDVELNERQRRIREMCFHIVLTQAPVAKDLREIFGYEHMSSDLERIADHAVSIAKIARSLCDLPDVPPADSIIALSERCVVQVRDMMDAVEGRDVAEAREVAARDDIVDGQYRRAFTSLVDAMTADGSLAVRANGLVFIAHHLERVADRVINIAEELIFAETGGLEDLR
jgi:phosphate transport system protein